MGAEPEGLGDESEGYDAGDAAGTELGCASVWVYGWGSSGEKSTVRVGGEEADYWAETAAVREGHGGVVLFYIGEAAR